MGPYLPLYGSCPVCSSLPARKVFRVSFGPALCSQGSPIGDGEGQLARSLFKGQRVCAFRATKVGVSGLVSRLRDLENHVSVLGRKLGSDVWTSIPIFKHRNLLFGPPFLWVHWTPQDRFTNTFPSPDSSSPSGGMAQSLRLPAFLQQGFPWARA